MLAGYGNVAGDNFAGVLAGYGNTVGGQFSAVVAGTLNVNNGKFSVIGGGSINAVMDVGSGANAFIGGGTSNVVSGQNSSVVGGYRNHAGGSLAIVGGGSRNVASGTQAVVPGGYGNVAEGRGSFAAGRGARALHNGTFVWSDQDAKPFVASTGSHQFIARASGGVTFYSSVEQSTGVSLAAGSGSWSSVSDRAVKTNVVPVDISSALDKVAALPISEWSYSAQGTGVRHMGPMAQDFRAAFGLGEDDRHITTIDEGGVALAAIKGLHAENQALRARLTRQEAEIAAVRDEIARLASKIDVRARH